MSNPYGDMYPLGDRYPSPENYPSAEAVSRLAMETAMDIAAQPQLNFSLADVHMRAFAGIFNGPNGVDELAYNRLSEEARTASHTAAMASYDYFARVGLQDTITDELDVVDPDRTNQYQQDRVLINRMQTHTSMLYQAEGHREHNALYKGLIPAYAKEDKPGFTREDPAVAERERLQADVPYSMEGVRQVVMAFGANLGPFIEDFYENANLGIDRRTIVHHANSWLSQIPARIAPE